MGLHFETSDKSGTFKKVRIVTHWQPCTRGALAAAGFLGGGDGLARYEAQNCSYSSTLVCAGSVDISTRLILFTSFSGTHSSSILREGDPSLDRAGPCATQRWLQTHGCVAARSRSPSESNVDSFVRECVCSHGLLSPLRLTRRRR